MIEQGLKDRKVTKVLIAQAVFELADFFGNVGLVLKRIDDLAANLPIKILDLGFIRQVHHAEGEHMLGVFLALQGIVIRFELV